MPFPIMSCFESTGNLWGWEAVSVSEVHISQYVEFSKQRREEPVWDPKWTWDCPFHILQLAIPWENHFRRQDFDALYAFSDITFLLAESFPIIYSLPPLDVWQEYFIAYVLPSERRI